MASKRKQSSSKCLLSVNNTSSGKDNKKQHIFNQPSGKQFDIVPTKWPSNMYEKTSEGLRIFDRCNISNISGGDKIFEQKSHNTCKRSSSDLNQSGEEEDEDWESGEYVFYLIKLKIQSLYFLLQTSIHNLFSSQLTRVTVRKKKLKKIILQEI